MRFIIITTCLILGLNVSLSAQNVHFAKQGTIQYEKTVFLKNLVKRYAAYAKDDAGKDMMLRLVDMVPENQVLTKKLSFTEKEAYFEPVKEEYPEMVREMMNMGVIESGIQLYQNLAEKRAKSAFELGGDDVLIDDAALAVKWKITNEYRTIAGYNCRRANGLVMDSIYVVAFYTDEIPVSAGPTGFSGLPGMIMGMAIPELHYTIFATKVEGTLAAPIVSEVGKKKAKPMTRTAVYDKLSAVLVGFLGEKMFNLVMAGYYL